MSPGENKFIDLKKLTQRELLILLNEKVESVKEDVSSLKKDNQASKLKVKELEVKVKVQGAIWGAILGLFVQLLFILSEKIL